MNKSLRPGQEVSVVANAIAVAISKNLTPTEENIIGNLITQVGATLLSIAAIDEACEDNINSSTNSETSAKNAVSK